MNLLLRVVPTRWPALTVTLATGCLLLLSTLSSASAMGLLSEETEIAEFAKTLRPQLPEGWSVAIHENKLTIQREQKALSVPSAGNRSMREGETREQYNENTGTRITPNVTLQFESRLSDAAWLELSAGHADVLERGKDGFRGKTELSEHGALVEKYKLPRYESDSHSIFESYTFRLHEIVDDDARQELTDVLAILKKTLPANRGMAAVADQPKIRWPQIWIDTSGTASYSVNTTKAQPLTAEQTLTRFNNDIHTGFMNPKWADTIDWENVPDYDTWIKNRRRKLARKPRDAKPRAKVVRFSKQQVEVKIIRTVGYSMGREYHSAVKHFRILRSPEVDKVLGLSELETAHLATYNGIGKLDFRDSVLKQLGEPDHVRSLQDLTQYDFYIEENITLFYRFRQVHTVTLGVPAYVKEEAEKSR